MREPYTYVLLRYRHDPASGEQLNVGVILWAEKSQYFGAKINSNFARVKKIFPTLDGGNLKRDLKQLQKTFDKLHKNYANKLPLEKFNACKLANQVLGIDDTSLVWSDMGSGLCLNPNDELSNLMDRFVLQYEITEKSKRNDEDIWKPFRNLLAEKSITARFEPKSITTDLDNVKFEHSYKNGKWHCFQPLSFDLTTEESIQNKAARWAGHMLGLAESSEEFQTYFLVGKPDDNDLEKAFHKAVKLLSGAPRQPRVVLETEINNFTDEISSVFDS